MALQWQTMQIPFAVGLDQGSDSRALQPPKLAKAVDIRFDEVGGIQTRLPFAAMGPQSGDAIADGSTLADVRKVVEYGDELLLFTKDKLLSYDPANDTYQTRGTHLAIKPTEESVFVTTGEQTDADRAELNGVEVFAWIENGTGFGSGIAMYAARSKETGTVILAPTPLDPSNSPPVYARPKLVALDSLILAFAEDVTSTQLVYWAIDPADPYSAAGSPLHPFDTNNFVAYDAVRVLGADACVVVESITGGASYKISYVSVVAGSVTIAGPTSKARTADGLIAVAVGERASGLPCVQVVRTSGANIVGDLLDLSTPASFPDIYTNQAIGTTTAVGGWGAGIVIGLLTQLTAGFKSTFDGGEHRCYVFWTGAYANGSIDWATRFNYVDTGNHVGAAGIFRRRLQIVSRPFDHNGHVYAWFAFGDVDTATGGSLQSTYFLYRQVTHTNTGTEEPELCGKFCPGVAASFRVAGTVATVATVDLDTYVVCLGEQRIIEKNVFQFYARAPRQITIEFDSDEARRTAHIGETLYIGGAEVMQYDGTNLVELGFHVWPWWFTLTEDASGSMGDGTYAYKNSWRWDNAKGERDRSAAVAVKEIAITGGTPQGVNYTDMLPLYVTHKTANNLVDRSRGPSEATVEMWRTQANPTDESDFYLVSNPDPKRTTTPNQYVKNDPTVATIAFEDEYADSSLEVGYPGNASVLEPIAPPAATILFATESRLFLGGVAHDPHRVWYSKYRNDGEVVAFNEALTVSIPIEGGDITALAFLNETLVVFRERAIYVVPGNGFDNTGGGQNYGPARRLPGNCGAMSQEAVAETERGLIFKSSKGWYVLGQGFGLEYVGGPVVDYDAEEIVSIEVVGHEIRCLSASRMLVLDELIGQWCERTISGLGAAQWRDGYVYLSSAGVQQESTFAATVPTYGLVVETGWIKMNDLQGWGRVREIEILGEHCGDHRVQLSYAVDYQIDQVTGEPAWIDLDTHAIITPPSQVAGSPLQFQFGPPIGRVEAFKLKIEALAPLVGDRTESLKLTGMNVEHGIYPGRYRALPAAQKT